MDYPQLTRIPLKIRSGKPRPDRGKIFDTFYCKIEVALTKLIDTNQGYIALCQNEQDIDTVLTEKGSKALAEINLEAKIPAQISTQRSIICRKLDPYVGGHTSEDIKNEIERVQTWAKVREVVKFGNYTHVIKITFESTDMAQRALDGLRLFNVAITSSQIERETFTNVQMCFVCYRMEQHQTKECPHRNIKVCSECAEEGHRYTECKNTTKKCINCNGDHRTMAMSCPMKKQKIKDKKEIKAQEKEIKETETYAKIVKETRTQELEERPVLRISKDTPTEVLICILHAHVVNIGRPGSYASELNEMLERNNLQRMWFPDNPPSGKILNMEILDDITQETTPAEASSTRQKPTTTLVREKTKETFKAPQTPKPKRLKKVQRAEHEKIWLKRMENDGQLETDSDQETVHTEVDSASSDQKHQTMITEIEERRISKEQKQMEKTKTTEPTIKSNYDTTELKMKIFYTSRFPLLPKTNIQDLLDGIKKGKYKYEYEHEIPERDLEVLLYQARIKIKFEHCNQISTEVFNKIRNGKCRSPPPKAAKSKEQDRRSSK